MGPGRVSIEESPVFNTSQPCRRHFNGSLGTQYSPQAPDYCNPQSNSCSSHPCRGGRYVHIPLARRNHQTISLEVIIHAEDYRSKLPRKVTPEDLQVPNHKMAIILRNIYFASNQGLWVASSDDEK